MALDQYNESINSSVATTGDMWQSFTCGIAGPLVTVEISQGNLGPGVNKTLSIYDGTGTGGTLLTSQAITITAGAGWKTFSINTQPILTVGQVCTIAIDCTSDWSWDRSAFPGTYAGGRAWEDASVDMVFRTYMGDPITINDTSTITEAIGFYTKHIGVSDTAAAADNLTPYLTATNLHIGDAGTITEGLAAPLQTVSDTGGIDVFNQFAELVIAPIFPITDTGTISELLARVIPDTATASDAPAVTVGALAITDTGRGFEVLTVDGPAIVPPGPAETGGLGANHVLRLLYGNDKRNPIRTLDLAESASGHIFLKTGGFAPGSGERNELWSGASIRFDGQRKLAESRQNTQLVVTYDLYSGSMTGLSELQRKINQFLFEAKVYNTEMRGERVWLEYRWSDNLSTLPTPILGQLSYYYEVYSGNVPKWPDDLHSGALLAGNVEGVALELTCSPYPEGITQPAAYASNINTTDTNGVATYTTASYLKYYNPAGNALAGNFTAEGWITVNVAFPPVSIRHIFSGFVNGSNYIRLIYDVTNTYWTITKVVSGTTYTNNSVVSAINTGDKIHLALVQDNTTLRLYVNGAEAVNVTAANTLPSTTTTIALGCVVDNVEIGVGTEQGAGVSLDGWRIFNDDLTSTQVAAIYTAELPIKTGGGLVGPPPYFQNLNNLTLRNGYYDWLIGGISGDVPAILSLYGVAIAGDEIWVAAKNIASEGSFVPDRVVFNYSTSQTGTSVSFTDYNSFGRVYAGRYRILARMDVTNSIPVTITPRYSYSDDGDLTDLPTVRYTGQGLYGIPNFHHDMVDLGEIFISYPDGFDSSNFSLALSVTGSSSFTAYLDRIVLIAYPYIRLTPRSTFTFSTDRRFIVDKDRALFCASSYTLYTNGLYDDVTEILGEIEKVGVTNLTVSPNQLNYVAFAVSDETIGFASSYTVQPVFFVTPRYLLPGGMVA